MKTTGRVNGIISNIVIVKADGPVGQNEICYVWTGDTKMMAEVIKVIGDAAYVQVFDSTRGLKIGDRVEFEGHMLEVTLAPGLLSRNYDGLQNDLEKMDSLFIERGSITDPIDFDKTWEFTPLAKAGDKVSAASWLGDKFFPIDDLSRVENLKHGIVPCIIRIFTCRLVYDMHFLYFLIGGHDHIQKLSAVDPPQIAVVEALPIGAEGPPV